MTETNKETAIELCAFFSDVFVKEDINGKINNSNKETKFEGFVGGFRVEAVKKKLCNLKPKKSPGPDGIHPMFCGNVQTKLQNHSPSFSVKL